MYTATIASSRYVFSDLKTFGWAMTILGACELLVAYGVYRRNQVARWIGVAALSLNAIAHLLAIEAAPFWSLSIFALTILALYGLIAYGQERPTPAT